MVVLFVAAQKSYLQVSSWREQNAFMEIGMTILRLVMLITEQKYVLYAQNMESSGKNLIHIFVV